MIVILLVLSLIIIIGVVGIIITHSNSIKTQRVIEQVSSPVIQQPPQQTIIVPEWYPEPWIRHQWRSKWRPHIWREPVGYPYYPQSMIDETCLNSCCDYENCISGRGCQWKTLTGEWKFGSPYQCNRYKNCTIRSMTNKNDKDRDNICLREAGL